MTNTPTPALPSDVEELLPCPFCGSNEVYLDRGPTEYWGRCSRCLASARMCSNREASIRAWNTRASTPTEKEDADELRTVAQAICKSRTCEGVSCCQWPANRGRTNCPVRDGGYDDAARDALAAISRARSASVTDAVWMKGVDLMITAEHAGGDTWWRGYQALKEAFFKAGGEHNAPWAHDKVFKGQLPDEGHPHLIDGEFQSDKYPTTPRGKVPLSTKDKTAQDLLWQYAQRRRAVDAEFATDLELALAKHGYTPPAHGEGELRAALKFYADKKNWPTEQGVGSPVMSDWGEIAVRALSHAPSPPQKDWSGVVEAAERVNKLAVQKAQMTCREHGTGSPQLYRDFMQDADRKLDEAFQAHYEALASTSKASTTHKQKRKRDGEGKATGS